VGARAAAEAMSERVRVAVLGSAAVPHTGRWAAALVARGIEARVWSLEPPREGDPSRYRTEVLPSSPLPGVLRYPLAAPALRRSRGGRKAPRALSASWRPASSPVQRRACILHCLDRMRC